MRYTGSMQTKLGVHYHVKVGPREVRLYDYVPMAGPYYDLLFDDMDKAHETLMGIIESHLPEYLDEEDLYESYEYIEFMTHEISVGEMEAADMGVAELGFEFELLVCSGCQPAGMN